MVEVVVGVVAHPDPLHHRARAQVAGAGERDDLLEAGPVEAELERRATRLGRVAAAPGRPGQPPTDLDRRHEGGLEPGHREAREADELAARANLERPEAEAVPLEARLDRVDQLVALGPR